jgi:uncharacterized membrane protein
MFSKWQWLFIRFTHKLWVRAALFAVMAIVTALIAAPVERLLPDVLSFHISVQTIDQILSILATSMLTVTTFSLGVMVSAFTAASTGTTPRATQLVREDPITQNVLATFLGAFLFSLVGIIALNTGVYGEGGRLVLFAATLLVIGIILIAILHWIEHLSVLGRVTETTDQVEVAAANALKARVENPHLGARCLPEGWESPNDGFIVKSESTGYICHVDIANLQETAEELELTINLLAPPGSFVFPGKPLACIEFQKKRSLNSEQETQLINRVTAAYTTGKTRSFEQDPRFGLIVLSEIASRALSPAVNDPGTAIDVLGRAVRLFCIWREHRILEDDDDSICFPLVRVPALKTSDLIEDLFMPVARDGAGLIEIQIRVQKSMAALHDMAPEAFGEVMSGYAELAFKRACKVLTLEEEVEKLKSVKCSSTNQ